MNDFIMVYVTASSKVEADKIAQSLLDEHLIACVNIVGPVCSRFHWAGKVDVAEEFLMIMKSRLDLFDALVDCVKVLHSYEVPEVVAVPIVCGSGDYFGWLGSVLKPPRTIMYK